MQELLPGSRNRSFHAVWIPAHERLERQLEL
jgi:hypothetical protein